MPISHPKNHFLDNHNNTPTCKRQVLRMATGLKRFNNYSPKAKHRSTDTNANNNITTNKTLSNHNRAKHSISHELTASQQQQIVRPKQFTINNNNTIICNMIPLLLLHYTTLCILILSQTPIQMAQASQSVAAPLQPPQVIDSFGRNEIVVGAGSNVSLVCKARGSQPLNFVWFQDERNLTTDRTGSEPQSTKLLEEKRYEIGELPGGPEEPDVKTSILYLHNLKITDTSTFLCWVENEANYSIVNYTLIVDDSPPTFLGGNQLNSPGLFSSLTAGETQIGLVSIGFVLLLLATVILLLIIKHKTNIGSTKSSQSSSDFKKPKSKLDISGPVPGSATHRNLVAMGGAPLASMGSIAGSHKFGNMGSESGRLSVSYADVRHSMLNDSDQGDADDDEYSVSDESSVSSYKKSNKIMASGELDGFIEHMRSGIINMDYHSMSPAIQFNTNTLKKNDQKQQRPQNQQTQLPPYSQQEHHMPQHIQSSQSHNHLHHLQQQHLQQVLHHQQHHPMQAQLQMQQVYKPVPQMTNVPISVGYPPPTQGHLAAAMQQIPMVHQQASHQQFYQLHQQQQHAINVNLQGVGYGGGHFPSASNASSAPYYGGPMNGSMATTTSDLSPGGSSAIMSMNKQMNCL